MRNAALPIAFDRLWRGNGWREGKTGAAVVSEADGVLTCEAAAGELAYRNLWLPAMPGMEIAAGCLARVTTPGSNVGIFLDVLDHDVTDISVNAARADFAVDDWRPYALLYKVPDSASIVERFVRMFWGVKVGAGAAQLMMPWIRVGRTDGAPLVIARGKVRLVNNVVSLLATYLSLGVTSVAFNGTTTVTVTLDHAIPAGPGDTVLPVVKLTDAGNHWFTPKVTGFTGGAAPTFTVQWTNGAALQNVAGIAQVLEFWFEVTF